MSDRRPDPVALVPLRAAGKTRLSEALTGEQRRSLATAMLTDVVHALFAAELRRVVVAAGGDQAIALARMLDLDVIADPRGADLDTALRAAQADLGPARDLLVVAADLPRLTASDVGTLLATEVPVAVAPTSDGGTGGLLRRPAEVIATAYGPDSARRHLHLAQEAGHATATVQAPGFAHDVDTPTDLAALDPDDVGDATAAFLQGVRTSVPPG